jgi:CRP/FNR family cyclic AMP-dependent transcriptional regulator
VSDRVPHSLVGALRSVPGFDALDEKGLIEVVGCSANLLWRAGSPVFTIGEPAEALFVVLSGEVRITEGGDGDEVEIARIRAGDYFGELSLLFDSPRSRNARVVEDAELLVVPKASFADLLADEPELAAAFKKRAEERLATSPDRS